MGERLFFKKIYTPLHLGFIVKQRKEQYKIRSHQA